MGKEIEQIFNEMLLALDPNNLTFEARDIGRVNIERVESLDGLSINKR